MPQNSNRLAVRLRHRLALFMGLLCVCLVMGSAISGADSSPSVPESFVAAPQESIRPLPRSTALDPKRVALGKRLFNDVRLSRDKDKSCATCHPLDRGAMDGLAHAVSGAQQIRNTPTLFNVGFNSSFNWDGISKSLEAQAEIVLRNPRLMNTTWPELLATLRADADYIAGFNSAYSGGLTPAGITEALASFARSLLTPNARFDRYLRGERQVLTPAELQGYELFQSYGCIACHQGINIGGNMYQKFGVLAQASGANPSAAGADLGRYLVTKAPRDREVFRVPSLRNVAVTAPYFHDGRARTLEEAVTTMAKVQLGTTLTARETELIVRFLHTLTGEYQGRLVGTPEQK
jgi:cytochrome c peroxidase